MSEIDNEAWAETQEEKNRRLLPVRLRHINFETVLAEIDSAIDDAQNFAGCKEPEECKERRDELDALRETVRFIFRGDK